MNWGQALTSPGECYVKNDVVNERVRDAHLQVVFVAVLHLLHRRALVVDALREVLLLLLLLLMMMREESLCAAIALPPHVAQAAVLVSVRGRPRVQPAEWEMGILGE